MHDEERCLDVPLGWSYPLLLRSLIPLSQFFGSIVLLLLEIRLLLHLGLVETVYDWIFALRNEYPLDLSENVSGSQDVPGKMSVVR